MSTRALTTAMSTPSLATAGLWPRLAALWLIAAVARALIALPFLNQPIALDDMFQYDMLARSLAAGHGYRWYAQADWDVLSPYLGQFIDLDTVHPPADGLLTVFRGPGYPFFLAAVYTLVPDAHHIVAARLVQVALLSLLAPLTACLALELGLGARVAWPSGVIAGLYPILLFYPLALASETLFVPLLAGALLITLRAVRTANRGWTLAAGVCLGACVLTRSVFTAGVIIIALWLVRLPGHRRQAGLLLATALAVCLPWTIRNSLVTGQPMFVEGGFGYNLFVANHPDGNGGFVSQVAVQPLSILDDTARDAYCREAAWVYVRADPGQALVRVGLRLVYFLGVEDRELAYFYGNGFFGPIAQPWLTGLYLTLIVPWMAVAALSVVGLVYRGDLEPTRLVLAVILGYMTPHLLIIAEPRFHLGLVPVLVPFAVHAWCARGPILRGVRAGKRDARPWLTAGLVSLVLATIAIGIGLRWNTLVALLGPDGYRIGLPY